MQKAWDPAFSRMHFIVVNHNYSLYNPYQPDDVLICKLKPLLVLLSNT
jgi:hypothetical protein